MKYYVSPTCKGFINLLMSYLKYNNSIANEKDSSVIMYGITDQIQNIEMTTCVMYSLYYGYNLTNPHEPFNFLEENGELSTVKKLISNILVNVIDEDNQDINLFVEKQFKEAFNIKAEVQDSSLLNL